MMQKLFFKALKKNGNSQKKINLCVQVTTAYNEKTCYHTTPEEKKYFQQSKAPYDSLLDHNNLIP